uniref:Uncharacterized protein n=1 Tax=Anopheles dirus TaxID=7168 RepID=A0A182NVZ3_9DIPT
VPENRDIRDVVVPEPPSQAAGPEVSYRAIAGTNARASISQLPDVYTHTNTHQTRAKASTSNNNNS